jgi:hypothetical protein
MKTYIVTLIGAFAILTYTANQNAQYASILKEVKLLNEQVQKIGDRPQEPVIVEKIVVKTKKVPIIVKQIEKVNSCEAESKNFLALGVGFGPNGLIYDSKNRTVEQKTGPVMGVSYNRKMYDNFRLGGEILTNKTILLNLGRDF